MDQKTLTKIAVGIVISLLGGIVGLLFHNQKKQQDFREAWEIDEKTEEAQMFDSANEKERVMIHVESVDPMTVKEMEMNQRVILEAVQEIKKTVKHQDSVNSLNADQIFQMKEEIKYRNN